MNIHKLIFFCVICILSSVSTFGASYYWVGGSGNWSDINHWRTSSGGTGIPGVIPGPSDDVFFDANSGFTSSNYTLTLNVPGNCRNITVSGTVKAPTISGNSSLNIYGSSVWQTGMSIASEIYYQDSGVARTITSNGAVLATKVYLNETSSVVLNDDFTANMIYINAGVFNTNNHRLEVAYLYMNQGTNARQLILGSSEVYIGYNFFDSTYVTLSSGTSTIYMKNTGAVFTGVPGHIYNNVSILKGGTISGGTAAANLIFNRVELLGGISSTIKGENTFKELFLAPGTGGLIQEGGTQTITDALIVKTDCSSSIRDLRTTGGTIGFISMPSTAVVDVSSVKLQNINAIGGAVFNAVNSINVGSNNTGWAFTYESSSDIYWVGGAGTWGDINHWSLTSGGAGGACVPTIGSNVFFDENSGFTNTSKTIVVDREVYCRDITFSGSGVAPTLVNYNEGAFNIYGSSIWQSGMTINISESLVYKSTGQAKTITSNGVAPQITRLGLYLEETESYSLLDDFQVNGSFYLGSGTFNTNGHRMDVTDFGFSSNSSKILNLGNSEVYIKNNFSDSQYATINAGTSHIYLTGIYSSFIAYQNHRYYDVTFLNPDATNAQLTGTSQLNANFNQVTFKGKGSINSNFTMKDLILSPGKDYSLYGNALIISNSFQANAECKKTISITGTTSGNLYLPLAVNVKVSNVILTNLKATGGGFSAVNSVDNGGNTGWTFSDEPIDLYWVGGAGDWNDINHWSFTSGGEGGACIPSFTSNVFFDANSGFTTDAKIVNLNDNGICRDIIFSGNAVPPSLIAASNFSLNVYGSSVWQNGMSINLNTLIYKNLDSPKTITNNGVRINTTSFVRIEETSSVSLLDDLQVSKDLFINAGTFNTNNFKIEVGGQFSTDYSGTALRTLNLGSSKLYIDGNFTDGGFTTVNSGTSHIYLKGTSFIGYNNHKYYDVTFLNEDFNVGVASSIRINGPNANVNDYKATFNKVTFKGHGNLTKGSCTFNDLVFTAGYIYNLLSNLTQTVNHEFTALADCKGVIQIKNSTTGKATLFMPVTAIVNVSNVTLTNIIATGGATFNAANSVDGGGNSGWSFTNSTIDLFWVGGSGNWNDINHWALTSGGEGGACLPSANSNVFFDMNSGFTSDANVVNLSSEAFCNDITFEDSPVVAKLTNNGGFKLNIYGSSVWQTGMTLNTTIYYQNTNKPKTITSNGVTIDADVVLYETTSVTLLDAFASKSLTIYGGELNTANNKMSISNYFAAPTSPFGYPTTLNLGNSDLYVGNTFTVVDAVTLLEHTSTIYITGYNAQFIGGANQYNKVILTSSNGTISGSSQANPTVFNQVEFYNGGGKILGYYVIKDLFFAPGGSYSINGTQTITGSLNAQSQCENRISITSTSPGIPTFFMPATAIVNVSNVTLTNIIATGGATFNAVNSIDNGGNNGWSFTNNIIDLFWVGGTGNWGDRNHWALTSGGVGGACVPSMYSNVFFDENSGFTATSRTVTINTNPPAFCRDIVFSGSAVAPIVRSYDSGQYYGLEIYGSSVWQSGMTLNANYIRYNNTGLPKTITSNGIQIGGNVTFEETTSISLTDDFSFPQYLNLYVNAGTFNSNGFQINGGYFYAINNPDVVRTINLGNSVLNLSRDFYAGIQNVKVNAGESDIHLTGTNNSFTTYAGQQYGNVTFETPLNTSNASITSSGTSVDNTVNFKRVEFKGILGTVNGNNVFSELVFPAQGTFTLNTGDTQVVTDRLLMSGNVCDLLFIKSSTTGVQANLMLMGGRNEFNFVIMRDINASGGLELAFGDKSTVANQNNLNISYETYNPGEFDGFKNELNCFFMDSDNPEHYMLSGDGFYGNQSTQYSWTKVNDPNFKTVIGNESSIDIRDFGFGTYKLEVKYREGCAVTGTITIKKGTDSVNVGLQPMTICMKKINTLDDLNIIGENIKWYTTANSTVSFTNATIQNGETYYITQTIDACESLRVPVTIIIKDCSNIYVNPNLRMRVKK